MATVTVEIPAPLQPFAGDADTLELRAATVAELLDALARRHPGLGRRVLDDDGKLRSYVNVFVGTEEIRALDGTGTSLRDGDVVAIIPAVAGG